MLHFQVEDQTLATLALFSYLGRESRLFLSRHNIKDNDEQVNDFIRYMFHLYVSVISFLTKYIKVEEFLLFQLLRVRYPLYISRILDIVNLSALNGGDHR